MTKRKGGLNTIPVFQSEKEEALFWERCDSTSYFSGEGKTRLKLPPRTATISLRLPKILLARLKKIADLKDLPYQSLMKVYIDAKVREEIISLKQ